MALAGVRCALHEDKFPATVWAGFVVDDVDLALTNCSDLERRAGAASGWFATSR